MRSSVSSSCSLTIPRSRALARILSRFRPPPSSPTLMTMSPPSWNAARVRVPLAGLPAATRSSGDSMPWSSELRTRCTRGSLIFSSTVLSTSVCSPIICNSMSLPSLELRSRTSLGKRLKDTVIGSMRILSTFCCSSRVLRSNWAMPSRRLSARSLSTASNCSLTWVNMDWVMTSSPTRLIRSSTLSMPTRIEPPSF